MRTIKVGSPIHELHEQLLAALRNSLEGAGATIAARRDGNSAEVDVLATLGKQTYAFELKVCRAARREDLEGGLARAALVAAHSAKVTRSDPVAIVGAPRISESVARDLGAFADRYLDGVAWGLVDSTGWVELHGPGLERVGHQRDGGPRRKPRSAPDQSPLSRSAIFSDLGQWALKLILSHLWLQPSPAFMLDAAGVVIDRPIPTTATLAARAGASVPTVARAVAALREDGFLKPGFPLEPIRERELLRHWRASALMNPPLEKRCAWILPPKDSQRQLDRLLSERPQVAGNRAALGLFAACSRRGFSYVTGVSPHLYLEDVSAPSLEAMGLVEVERASKVDVFVRQPRFPESVFRGARTPSGPWVTDILQCWLDVADYPARGEEMASLLERRVLVPNLVGYG